MITRITLTAALLATLPFHLGATANAVVDPLSLRLNVANPASISLRIMAEIDGNPETFTVDEKRKHLVLSQVLGTSPTPHFAQQRQFGS